MTRSEASGPSTATGSPAAAGEIGARIDRIPTVPFHGRLVAVLGAGTFFDGFDAISIAVVLPFVIASLHLGFGDAGLIVSVGYAGQFAGALVVGALADRIGRRRAFIFSLLVFGLFSIGCALASSEGGLLAFRLLQGLGLGAEIPVAGVILNEYLGRRTRGRMALVYQAMFGWGLFFGPLVALGTTSLFGPAVGWRVLLAIGALPIGVAVWAWFVLPESARWLASQGRLAEAEREVARMEAQARARGLVLDEPEPVPPARSSRLRLGELFSPGYRSRTLVLVVVWFTTFFVAYGTSTWLPTMYVTVGGLPASAALGLTVLAGAVQISMTYLVAMLIDRFGRRLLLCAGFVIATLGCGFGALALGVFGRHTWPYLLTSGLLISAGVTIPAGVLYLYTSELYPTRMRGWATSACSSVNRLASIVSPFLFGYMLGGHGGSAGMFVVLAAAALIGCFVMAIGGVETRHRSLEAISP